MRYSSPHNSSTSGFTLVEILVIAPIVLLAIGGFIALMVTMVGDVMVSRDNNTMLYDAQDALKRIEGDVRLSTEFLTTTGTLISPQGSNSNFTGTAAFTNAVNTLILNSLVTDQSPVNSSREIIYYKDQPNACGATKIFNNILYSKVIYFIKDGSLWRRTTIAPFNTNATTDSQTVCATPWQQDSCSPGYTATRCKTNDVEVMQNVSSLNVEYYNSPSSTSNMGVGNAGAASTIKVTITAQKQTATKTITVSQSLRATRLNTAVLPSS
jgi:hypothetical protein